MAAKPRRKCSGASKQSPGASTIPPLGGRPAELAAVLAACEPGKHRHSATGRNPCNRLLMFGHESAKLRQVLARDALCSFEYGIAVTHS